MENLYEVLQVSENASNDIIENAYKTLVKKYHPDIAKNKQQAEEKMKIINNAHDILSDEKKRANYDEKLRIEREKITPKQSSTQPINYNANNANIRYTTNNTDNKYDQDYDNYYDYINNYNIFDRIKYSSSQTKRIVAIILLIIIFLVIQFVFLIGDLFGDDDIPVIEDNGDNNTASQTSPSKQVGTSSNNIETPKDENVSILTNQFLSQVKQSNINNINQYTTEGTKISQDKINAFKNDIDIYSLILKDFKYEIVEYSMNNENEAIIQIKIVRIDIANILNDYVIDKVFNNKSGNIYNIQIDINELINIINDTEERITINDKIKLNKINNEWKISLSNNNIKNIFGTNLEEDEFILTY